METSAVLERSIEVTISYIKRRKWWKFWDKKREVKRVFNVPPLKLAQQLRINAALVGIDTSKVLGEGVKVIEAYSYLIKEHYKNIVYSIGVLLTEDAEKEPSKELIRFIETKVDNEAMFALFRTVIVQSDQTPFINGIISVLGVSLPEMNPSQ